MRWPTRADRRRENRHDETAQPPRTKRQTLAVFVASKFAGTSRRPLSTAAARMVAVSWGELLFLRKIHRLVTLIKSK
jgi:hypothetical protein